ncbi:helix-turn-helix domain-containing protein [Actinocatenispora comari]|uniref:HTH luxR-type domain-containing protein n=1 Tax=Actinocatenispora comari TaxID=2807577 RepID=A0A8J4A9X3_9ACTN|nr:helix-turn-helix domain-containing protein [Actinocatenispora comari]GIL27701.1 hypothetical protein NUM_29550 [Actinocatenispora comari]
MWEAVGIPNTEARIYEALIPRGQSTVVELAERAGFSAAQTARSLARLSRRGLVTRLPGRPARFSAAEPSLAGSVLIAKREDELHRLQDHLGTLDDRFRTERGTGHPADHLEVIEGSTAVWRTFVRVQRAAQEQIRAIDKPPYFVPPGEHGDDGPNLEERRHLREGRAGYRVIYDHETIALPGRLENIWDGIRLGEQARVCANTPIKLVLSDRKLAVLAAPADLAAGVAFLIHPSSLLDVVAELFEALWAKATPLHQPAAGEAGALDDRDRQILGLLAVGATDAAIARNFGWSIRTVQRNIHRLMTELGATTRFQTGMEAVRRGWL